jgi:hypothetical protein
VLQALRGLAVGIPARDRAAASGASYTRPGWSIFGEIYAVAGTRFTRTAFRTRRARRVADATRLWPFVRGDGFAHCGGVARERP